MNIKEMSDLRKNLGINLSEMSRRTGLNRNTLAKIESNKIKSPSFDSIEKMVEALGFKIIITLK